MGGEHGNAARKASVVFFVYIALPRSWLDWGPPPGRPPVKPRTTQRNVNKKYDASLVCGIAMFTSHIAYDGSYLTFKVIWGLFLYLNVIRMIASIYFITLT